MSHSVDDVYGIYETKWRRAREAYECDACDETIPQGHIYCAVFFVLDKAAESLKRCAKCETIHKHLRELGMDHDMWPAERLDCGETYKEHWGREPPAELEAIAFMTAEEAQRELVADDEA